MEPGDVRVWALFNRYFVYVLGEEGSEPHRLSQFIHSAIEASAGSLQALALTLSVGIEGLLRTWCAELCTPSPEVREEVAKARDVIKESSVEKGVRDTIAGILGMMTGFHAQRGIEKLVNAGAIAAREADAWKKLRNKRAHGDLLESMDFQVILDCCFALTVMFYRVVFTIIGYEGRYTDYGDGAAQREHPKVDLQNL